MRLKAGSNQPHYLSRMKGELFLKAGAGILSHIGIIGNEIADKTAKEATKHECVDIRFNISTPEIKSIIIKQKLRQIWQRRNRKKRVRCYFKIQRKVGYMRDGGLNWRKDLIISHFRFGHTGLNISLFKIGMHATVNCIYCNQEETIKHIMISCKKYRKQKYSLIQNLEKNPNKIQVVRGNICYPPILKFLRCPLEVE